MYIDLGMIWDLFVFDTIFSNTVSHPSFKNTKVWMGCWLHHFVAPLALMAPVKVLVIAFPYHPWMVYLPTWMVDVFGKCKYINMTYMDPVAFAGDTILNPNMNLVHVSIIEDIIESNFELNSRYLFVHLDAHFYTISARFFEVDLPLGGVSWLESFKSKIIWVPYRYLQTYLHEQHVHSDCSVANLFRDHHAFVHTYHKLI